MKVDKMVKNPLFLLFLAAILGGGLPVMGKLALAELPPFTFTFIRFSLAFVFLAPLLIKKGNRFNILDMKLILITTLAMINVVLFAYAISSVSVFVSQIVYTSGPLIAAIGSYYLLNEKFSPKKILGILIGFIGILSVVIFSGGEKSLNSSLLGVILISIASVAYTTYTVLTKKYLKQYTATQLIIALSLFASILFFFLGFFDFVADPQLLNKITPRIMVEMLYVGVLGTVGFYVLVQQLVLKSTPVIASMIAFLAPIVASVWAYFVFGERLTLEIVLGTVLVFIGVWLTTRGSKSN